jgi:hypothetical protein
MAIIPVYRNEGTASRRRVTFRAWDAIDGITPETNEAFNQPQISTDGAAWTNNGIGTLVHVGNGLYYAEVQQSVIGTPGQRIYSRYKSAATAEADGDILLVTAFDPFNPQNLGLNSLPIQTAGALNGLPLGDASGRVTVGSNLDKAGYELATPPPTAPQIRQEMDANSTHLASMDNRLPGTPAQFGQIGTPGRGTVAAELSQISAVSDSTYTKVPDKANVPTLAQIVDGVQNDRAKGTTTGTPTTTSVPCTGGDLSSTDDVYNNAWLLATSGDLKGIGRKISDYTGSSKTFTTAAWPAALAAGVTVSVIGNDPS